MKSFTITSVFAAFTLLVCTAAFGAEETLERYALIVGSNSGGIGTATLKYAASDAQHFQDILTRMGGVKPENNLMLFNPEKESLLQGLTFLQSKIRKNRKTDRQAQFVFYYSGHSDDRGLLLGGEKLDYADLKAKIDAVGAEVQIVILDSCSSGAFTRSKGGQIVSPFLQDLSTDVEGHAFLTSSTAEEVSQESDRIQSSFFTHALLEGLRGAADANNDGRVTLNEIYDYAYSQTLADTQKTTSGSQHPAFDIKLNGKGNLVLTDLHDNGATLSFPEGLKGRITIRDISNRLIVEVQKTADKTLNIGVEEGYYKIGLSTDGKVYETTKLVDEPRSFLLAIDSFRTSATDQTQARGADFGEIRIVPSGMGFRYVGGEEKDVFDLNLLMAQAPALDGIMVSFLANNVQTSSSGWQGSLFANSAAANFQGFQSALAFNGTGGDMNGIQIAAINVIGKDLGLGQIGLVNSAAGNGRFLQFGALNLSGENFAGIQFGLVGNIAKNLGGVQFGLFNYAENMTGVQIGLLNISQNLTGIPIGLIDIQMNGQNHLDQLIEATGDSWETVNKDLISTTVLRFGSEYFYKFLSLSTPVAYAGTNDVLPPYAVGLGLGFRFPLGLTGLAIHLDGSIRLYPWQPESLTPLSPLYNNMFVPGFRTFASWSPGKGFGLLAGWDHPVFTKNYHQYFSTSGKQELDTPSGKFFVASRLFLGVQF